MEAEQVWKLWRRLLRDENLQAQLFSASGATQWLEGFNSSDCKILSVYAQQFDRVKWFVENYQFRLINSFLNALETGAPLSLRALLHIGLDLNVQSKAFLRHKEWLDYGPRVYTYCEDALDFLAEVEELQAYPEILDMMRLERESVRLYRGLVNPQELQPDNCYQRTPTARVYETRYALSGWLRQKDQLGLSRLPEKTEQVLIYLPNPQARHKFTLISPRAAYLYKCLEQHQFPAGLSLLLNADSASTLSSEDLALLGKLEQLNAIRMPR
ncbi:hypothetical protein PSCICN_23090 [Pseudomonas cichorii]|uniref:hypothetical protein n=1 Tax=Pseudomonas cichorii TaxID=36746 RepID=UPI0019102934|nr:hypothetical protein [Pseudomonas cichorii]GFM81617.1 hypothetical protein PSCICN_23090 [Pseudomonas cichorii]